MKRINYLLNGFLLAGLIFTGCKKEDETTSNLFVDDNTYELSHGYIEYYGNVAGTTCSMGLDLLSSGMTMDESGVWHKSGVGIWFHFISEAKDFLPTGTYAFGSEDISYTLKAAGYTTQFIENTSTALTYYSLCSEEW